MHPIFGLLVYSNTDITNGKMRDQEQKAMFK